MSKSENSLPEEKPETNPENKNEKKIMKVICAWCGKYLGETESEIEGVSGGICPECLEKKIKKIKGTEKEK